MKENVAIGDKYRLAGILTVPDIGKSPYPAVVLVPGSGATDKDGRNESQGLPNKFFADIADGLASHGIASIRYDKRIYTYPTLAKDLAGTLTVHEDIIEDALLAADLIRADPRIDNHRIFLLGQSQGGALAPRIASESGNGYAGIILTAGTPRKMAEIVQEQLTGITANLKGIIKWIATWQVRKILRKLDQLDTYSEEQAKQVVIIDERIGGVEMTAHYIREMDSKPAVQYLKTFTKPILILQGEKDFMVSPEKDFQKYQELLADHPAATFILYPSLNHLFMKSIYGDISKAVEEYQVKQHVEPQVITDIASWITTVSAKSA